MSQLRELAMKRGHWLLLAGIICLGGWLRLDQLELMEFKGDEWRLHALAVAQASGEFQTAGITASIGVRNPPMAVYCFAVPALVSRSPLAAAGFVALLNTLAIFLAYLLARRWMKRGPALLAALLFAVSPWAVLASRKIWAQDLLPVFTIGFFLASAAWLRRGRWRDMLLAMALLSALTQIHLSGVALWPVLGVLFWMRRSRRTLAQFGAGALLFVALWTPYFIHLARTHGDALTGHGVGRAPSAGFLREAWSGAKWQVKLMGHAGFTVPLGGSSDTFQTEYPITGWTSVLLGALLVGGVAVALSRLRRQPELWLLLLWLALPPLLLALHRIHHHYLFISSPAAFIAVGLLADQAARRMRVCTPAPMARMAVLAAALAVLAAVVAEEMIFWRQFLHFVSRESGAIGDYGVPYRDKLALARHLAEQAPEGSFQFVDLTHPRPDTDAVEYLYRESGGAAKVIPTKFPGAVQPLPLFVALSPAVDGRVRLPGNQFREAQPVEIGPLRVQRFDPVIRSR